jgi:hypothetical protein
VKISIKKAHVEIQLLCMAKERRVGEVYIDQLCITQVQTLSYERCYPLTQPLKFKIRQQILRNSPN